MLARHGDLAAHPLRHKPNFMFTLWKDAQEALALGIFPSPLASFDNRSGLRASDLLDAFNHIDRCTHFDAPNTNASKNRADIDGDLLALKVDNQAKLSKQGMPQTILDLFDPERTIIQMFSRAEDVSRSAAPTPCYCSAGDEDDDPEMGEGGFAEVNMLLPLVGSGVATLKARAPATHLERIGNLTVKTVTTRGPPLFLRSTSDGKSEWAPVSVKWGGPKEIQVSAHQFGPLSVVSSLRSFFSRERARGRRVRAQSRASCQSKGASQKVPSDDAKPAHTAFEMAENSNIWVRGMLS